MGAADEAETDKGGRPEGGADVTPLPSPNPKDPKPPELPKPNPGEPDPIPKRAPKFFMADPTVEKALNREATPQAPGDPTPTPPAPPRARPGHPTTPTTPPPHLPRISIPIPTPTEGNAIYRIDQNGFVTEGFLENVMILLFIEKD